VRTVDPARSTILNKQLIYASATDAGRVPAEADLKKLLVGDLDTAFKELPAVYWYALNAKDQKDNAIQKSVADGHDTRCLLATYTHTDWSKFNTCYTTATGLLKKPPHGFLTAREALYTLQTAMIDDGALQAPRSGGPATGKLTFFIVASKAKWSSLLSETPPVALRPELVQYLDSFDNSIWRADYIRELIGDFYSRRGLAPSVVLEQASKLGAGTPSITIGPELRITAINLIPPADDDYDRRLALYNLLSSGTYENVRNKKPARIAGPPVAFDSVSLPAPQPVFNQFSFAASVQALSGLGFTTTEHTTPDGTGIVIQVEKTQPKSAANAKAATPPAVSTGKPAVPSLSPVQAARPAIFSPVESRPRTPAETKCDQDADTVDSGCQPDAPPKDKKGFIGAGFSYLPGQGFRPIAALEYDRLGPANITLEGGSANQLVNGTASASFDYINFRNWDHRVTLNLNGGTDTAYHRLIGIKQVDERRTGGKAHAQFELIRDPLGSTFSLYADAGAQAITITGAAALSDTLASGDFGAVYSLSRLDSARPVQLRLEPVVRAGRAAAGAFVKAGLTANYHQETLGAFVFEVRARFEQTSRLTPVYELPSFGGVSSLRGFRADDLLGRRLWTVQPEIWTAVPFTGAPDSAVAKFISRSVRLASFFDAGGAWQTLAGTPGFKAGPGAGLRVQYGQATFRADWAYGLGEVATGAGHGRFYFSVSTPII
jgi:hypothetical protein